MGTDRWPPILCCILRCCDALSFTACRSVRCRRFQALSGQDILLFLVIGVLSGLFWLQRCGHDTVSAAQDTLGELPFSRLESQTLAECISFCCVQSHLSAMQSC